MHFKSTEKGTSEVHDGEDKKDDEESCYDLQVWKASSGDHVVKGSSGRLML